MNRFSILTTKVKTILIVQSIAMLMGTFTHVSWAIHNGFLSEKYNAPILNTLFWDSLTFLDPLAAILLYVRPKTGLILTISIILTDVLHNTFYYADELFFRSLSITEWISTYWMILGQWCFAAFTLITFRFCWRRT